MASKFWIAHNEDARAAQNRASYVAENGGQWVNRGGTRGWHHTSGEPKAAPVAKEAKVKKAFKFNKKK
tara:strand:+ start:10971 stop:11174 length:204 start_codon:yes stop_codon:yes gene_type:complete